MTHTGATRPTDRNIARFGQFQNALVGRRLPVCGEAAPRERYQRTGVGIAFGQMRDSRRRTDDAWSHRLAAVEDLDVNALGRDAEGRKARLHVCHEASRPAEVDVRLLWNTGLVE